MASRGWQISCERLTPLQWTWFLCLLMCRVGTTVTGTPYTENVIQSTSSNWWNASQGCEEFGGNLYIPPSLESHEDLAAILDPGQTYWIGAMEYSTWTWTSDNSPLYEHTGYIQFPPSGKPTEIEGNTAFLCDLHCGKTYTRIGLSGKSCYCLVDEGYRTNMGKTVTEVRCSGNYDEWCGDDKGISVYEIVDMDINQAPDGQCVYARKNRKGFNPYTSSFHNDGNCSTLRSHAFTETGEAPILSRCRGSTCVEHGYRSWDDSGARHTLLKVSDVNLDDLTYAMAYTVYPSDYYTYWIGLRRLYRRVWINARALSSSTSSDSSTTTSSPPFTPSTETPPESESPSPTHATSTTSSSAIVRLNTGTRIGISAVCVAILALTVAAFVIMKRRKLLFFGAKPTTNSTVNVGFENRTYTMSEDEHIYESVTEYPGRHGQPPLPIATVRPMINIYMNDPQNSKEEGYDVLSECSSFVAPSVKPYDRVVVGGDGTVSQGGYDRARILNVRPQFNSNLSLGDNGCPGQYENLNLKDNPGQVGNGQPEESDRADDRNRTIPGAQTTYHQHQNRRVADPVYENISRCEKSFSDDDDVSTGNVCKHDVITSHNGCYYNNRQALETETAIEKDGSRDGEATNA